MKEFIHISDISFGLSFPILFDTPDNLIEKMREKLANSELFLINVNYKTENIARADNAGILFLKNLRLNHFNQHCVLYSFLSREQLMMQDPHNLIIFTEGVTFIRMPEDLSKLDYVEVAKKRAPENLSEYLRAGFSLPEDNRHNWANWWGIERLWQVHQAVIGKNKKDIKDYSSSLFIKKMQSIEALTALYLYPVNDDQIKEAQRDSEIERLKNEITLWNNLIVEEKRKKERCDREYIQVLQTRINGNNSKINDIGIKAQEGEEIRTLRDKIAEDRKNIVLIDDQSGEGWEAVFRNMLYNENDALYSHFSAPVIDSTNTCLQHIKENTDIVLLDLRLKDEQGSFHDVSKLSGVVLLKKIIERYPGLPVVIITASNKFRSYQTIMDLGADAYWVKEGLDSRFNEKETFENYKLFLELIGKLSGKEYKLLKSFSKCVDEIKKNSNPWWKNHKWTNPDGCCNISQISEVTELLDYGVMLYRKWLKMFLLNSDADERNDNNKSKLLANIINTLSGIVELVHLNSKHDKVINLYKIGAEFLGEEIKIYRGDFLGFYIYCIRNIGSHISNAKNISYDFFEFFIKILLTWLSVDYSKIDVNDVGIKGKKGFKDVYDSKKIIQHCEGMILTKSDGDYKYNDYANFYLKILK